jgi:phosphohistidine phosphatase
LIRHAKSTWDKVGVQDHDRPLDARGESDAIAVGEFLAGQGIHPDLILTSDALRAYATAELIAKQLSVPEEKIVKEVGVYDAGVEDLLAILQKLPIKYNTVILVGHNPGLTWLANYLADDHLINLPTCGVYCVAFEADDWSDITTSEYKTLFVNSPQQQSE